MFVAVTRNKKIKKENKKKELKPWLKLNQQKTICFFVTVANIPAFKMTHLLLAGAAKMTHLLPVCVCCCHENYKKKENKKKELKPWLKLNQRKTICFFVTVANIPAFKMTHLLLAGLPR